MLWVRQLEGALNRVPNDFYVGIANLLERCPGGLRCWQYVLAQSKLNDMEPDDFDFQLDVDQVYFIPIPHLRHLILLWTVYNLGDFISGFANLEIRSLFNPINQVHIEI